MIPYSTYPIANIEDLIGVLMHYRGSYMSAHVLLNLLNKLGKSDLASHFIACSQRV